MVPQNFICKLIQCIFTKLYYIALQSIFLSIEDNNEEKIEVNKPIFTVNRKLKETKPIINLLHIKCQKQIIKIYGIQIINL